MKKLKKVGFVFGIIALMGILTACEEMVNEEDVGRDLNASLTDKAETSEKTTHEQVYKDMYHALTINDLTTKIKTTYGIDAKYADNWVFTYTSDVSLQAIPIEQDENLVITVTGVYSDVSVISQLARTNGLRQDSIHLDYSGMNQDGYTIDTKNDYTIPFQVEGINQNETAIQVYNGYGSSTTSRITEKDIRTNAKGARLSTVWYLSITDKRNNQTYLKTVNDKIMLPIKELPE